MPAGYLRTAANIICKVVTDPANPQQQISIPISDYPMMNAWLQKDPNMLHFDSVVERNKVGQISIDLEYIGTNEMRKVLQSQGFMLGTTDKFSGDFFVSWVKKLQQIKTAILNCTHRITQMIPCLLQA